MEGNFLEVCVVDVVSGNTAAGTSDTITTSVVDMAGYDEATFLVYFGDVTVAAVVTPTVKVNTANSTSSPTPTVGKALSARTCTATDTDNKIMAITLTRPAARYAFLELVRATANAAINGIICIRRRARTVPVTQSTDVVASGVSSPN